MTDFKAQFIREHERLVEDYVEVYGEKSRHAAYDLLGPAAYEAARESYADAADTLRQRVKDAAP